MSDRPPLFADAERRAGRARGQVFVIFALALVGLVGMLGLVLDGGVLYVQRRTAQNGADAAALAGAYALNQYQITGGTSSDTTVAAGVCKYVLANRSGTAPTATASFVDASMKIVGPIGLPTSCTGALLATTVVPASAAGVQVSVTIGPYNTYLVGIVGVRQLSAGAQATASISNSAVPQSVVGLNATLCPAVNVTSGSHLTVVNGGMQVNSNCSSGALQVDDRSSVKATRGAINVVGTVQATGELSITPRAVTGVSAIADPFASLPIPNLSGLPSQAGVLCSSGATMTINPGVYPYVWVTGGCTLNMRQGNYVIGGPDNPQTFHVDGGAQVNIGSSSGNTTIVLVSGMNLCCVGSARPVGTNVLFYNACAHYLSDLPGGCHPGDQFGGIDLTGGIDMSLVTPQTSGPYQNMTIFQDRVNTSTMAVDGGVALSAGTIYGKAMPLTITGEVTAPVQFIVDSLSLRGGSTVTDTVTTAQKAPGATVIGMTQ